MSQPPPDQDQATWGDPPAPAPRRLPVTRAYHRRAGRTWSKETFWVAACRRFAIDDPTAHQGELI